MKRLLSGVAGSIILAATLPAGRRHDDARPINPAERAGQRRHVETRRKRIAGKQIRPGRDVIRQDAAGAHAAPPGR